jgi:hypothetical protein
MASILTTMDEGNGGFVLRRSVGTGLVSEIDPVAKRLLDDLNALLSKPIFKLEPAAPIAHKVEEVEEEAIAKYAIKHSDAGVQAIILATYQNARATKSPLEAAFDKASLDKAVIAVIKQQVRDAKEKSAKEKSAKEKSATHPTRVTPDMVTLLKTELTPPQTDDTRAKSDDRWQKNSLAWRFKEAIEAEDQMSLSEYIDSQQHLSALKYEFQKRLERTWGSLDDNIKLILVERPAIQDYLVGTAYAHEVLDINAVMNFVVNGKNGFNAVVDYAAVGTARVLISREKLKVPGIDQDASKVVQALKEPNPDKPAANIPLTRIAFNSAAKAVINPHIFDQSYATILDDFLKRNDIANDQTVRQIRPLVLKYIKSSLVPVTLTNADSVIPPMIAQARSSSLFLPEPEPTELDGLEAEKDFEIDLFDDAEPQQEVSEAAVKCAAQLFYGMVLGDELDIFNVINFFTHKYLVRGQIEIQDRRLRDDLQMYVFSGKFTDLKTGKIVDRTRPAERQMFYGQVFNYGNAPAADDMVVRNQEYQRLWKVLMLESARYLERAQISPNPQVFVSKQNVMQAVEDLQYNLSTHCVGMATVISPLIHAELDFVIRRILMRDEVKRQVAPAGGSWWRVVENLYMAMKNTRPKATILYNKAKLGNSIIRKVAEYGAAKFDNNVVFSSFISDVDAFITTQSILQEALTDDLKKSDDDHPAALGPMNGSGTPSANGSGSASGAGDARDDWDF